MYQDLYRKFISMLNDPQLLLGFEGMTEISANPVTGDQYAVGYFFFEDYRTIRLMQ